MTINGDGPCVLCGADPARGRATVDLNGETLWLCHDDQKRTCYVRWTVYGERPDTVDKADHGLDAEVVTHITSARRQQGPHLTTSGFARLRDGYVTIEFGVFDGTSTVQKLELNVDAYALELARDLLTAISEQQGIEEEIEDDRR